MTPRMPAKRPSFRNLVALRYIAAISVGAVIGLCVSVFFHQSYESRLLNALTRLASGVHHTAPAALTGRAEFLAMLLAVIDVGVQGACVGIIVSACLVLLFDGLRKTALKRFTKKGAVSIYVTGCVFVAISGFLLALFLGIRSSWTELCSSYASYPEVDLIRTVSREGTTRISLPAAGKYNIYFSGEDLVPSLAEALPKNIALCSLTDLQGREIQLFPVQRDSMSIGRMDYVHAYHFTVTPAQAVLLTCHLVSRKATVTVLPEGMSAEGPLSCQDWSVAGMEIGKGTVLTRVMVDYNSRDVGPDLPIPRDAVAEGFDFDKAHWVARRDIHDGEPILWRDFDKPLNSAH
jgi:hypothetical protein